MVVETGLADRQQSLGESLAVLEEEEILILYAVEEGEYIPDLLLKLLLLQVQLQPSIRINRQQFLYGHWQLRVNEGLFNSALVVGSKVTNG